MLGRHVEALLEARSVPSVAITRKQWDLSCWVESQQLDQIFGDVSAVIHVGAAVPSAAKFKTGRELFDVNVRATVALAEWAVLREVPLVYISGATVYEAPHAKAITESARLTTNNFGGFYGFTKYMSEQVLSHYVHQGLNLVVLRPSSLYGYGLNEQQLVARFLTQARNGQTIRIARPCGNRINFVHCFDVANAAIQALEEGAWGTYNIASDTMTSVLELAQVCIEQEGLGETSIEPCDGQSSPPFCRYDLQVTKAAEAFGYRSTISLREGIKLMAERRFL